MARLIAAVRLDASDEQVYERAAGAGEWLVPGTFAFWDLPDQTLAAGKTAQAFRHGFLGLESFGRATVACVREVGEAELENLTRGLARHLVERYGAPDVETALPAAREEMALALGLAEHPVGTLLTVERELDGGEIRERFKVVHDRRGGVDHGQVRLWEILPDERSGAG